MNSHRLSSCLATAIANFIRLRQLSGTDYASQARLLESFDRFLVQRKLTRKRLSRELLEAYQASLSGLAPRSQGNRCSVVRQFCRYLAQSDPLSHVPEPFATPTSVATHSPHIFTLEEIQTLLGCASRLPPAGSLRPLTHRTLFGLLYSTGIRIGEALASNIDHFLPTQQRLLIAQGKFRKARWIPLSPSTGCALQSYLRRRLRHTPRGREAPLLLNLRQRRLSYSAVRPVFQLLLRQAGIPWDRRRGPRIHHLRHTFAVHRLLGWYREGQDVNARLPALATYLGHLNLASTQVYLRPTAELLAEVHQRFHCHYLKHPHRLGESS